MTRAVIGSEQVLVYHMSEFKGECLDLTGHVWPRSFGFECEKERRREATVKIENVRSVVTSVTWNEMS